MEFPAFVGVLLRQRHQVQFRFSRLQVVAQRDVRQYLLALLVTSERLSAVPHRRGVVVGIAHIVKRVRAEYPQVQFLGQCHLGLHMNVKVTVVLVLFLVQQRHRVTDPQGLRHLVIFAVGISLVRKGWDKRGCRVEQLLLRGQVVHFLYRSHHTQIHRQVVVKGLLRDVELGNEIPVALSLDYRLVVCHRHRGTVVSRLRTTTEGDVMPLHQSRALNGLVKVGVIAFVYIAHAPLLGCLPEACGIGHLQTFVYLFKTEVAVV